jgi:hypothetical protein
MELPSSWANADAASTLTVHDLIVFAEAVALMLTGEVTVAPFAGVLPFPQPFRVARS